MTSLFLFDDIVNQVLEGTIVNWLNITENKEKLKKIDDILVMQLHLICLERGIYNAIQQPNTAYFFCTMEYNYIMLYSKNSTANVRKNILNALEYTYRDKQTCEMYHLIKNQFYEGISVRLDKERFFSDNIFSLSKWIAVAIKNKDIRCLKLFFEKNFRLNPKHMQYLMDNYSSYMNEHVLPILKEYDKGGCTE